LFGGKPLLSGASIDQRWAFLVPADAGKFAFPSPI
jgi:hypothetical protein